MIKIPENLKSLYKKYKLFILITVSLLLVTILIIGYNFFFNSDNNGERTKCGTAYCDKDETCDDLCSTGTPVCMNTSCPVGQIYYCDRGDGTAGCAPLCSPAEALNKCTDGITFKCIPSTSPDGTINVIDTDDSHKDSTYCSWANEGPTSDNCKLYDPQDNGKLYSSCVNQTDNYGKILEGTFTQNNKQITCGVPKGGKPYTTSSTIKKGQRTIPTYNTVLLDDPSSTKNIYSQCGLPDSTNTKESFTLIKDSPTDPMSTICTNTNTNFLDDSGNIGNVPDPTFCKYDYTSGACFVNKSCDPSLNYSFNEYSYLMGCTPYGKQMPGDKDDCYKIPTYMFPNNKCNVTTLNTQCLPGNGYCTPSYEIGFSKLQQACEIDTDGCGVDTSTGSIIPYTLSGKTCIATVSTEQKSTNPITPGCRNQGDTYAWNGTMCYQNLNYNIIDGVNVTILSSVGGGIGISTLNLNLTIPDTLTKDTSSLLSFVKTPPDSLTLFCYQINGDHSIKYDINNPQVYFDTSEAVSNYSVNLKDNTQVQTGDSIVFEDPTGSIGSIIFASEDINTDNNKNMVVFTNKTTYYLGVNLSWGGKGTNSLVLTSLDLNLQIKNENNIFINNN